MPNIKIDRHIDDREELRLIRKLRNRLLHQELPDQGRRGEFRTEWLEMLDESDLFEKN